jgi:acetylornithine deacetylase/succinyl-diaminopimelate desuccinylase-like protein
MTLTLTDFEERALPTLWEYAGLKCLSPMFDANWRQNGEIDRAIELLATWARGRDLGSSTVEVVRLADRTPLLVVTVEATGNVEGTTVMYGHMDKQPPLGQWSEGLDPFTPVRRENRIYARGVADDGYSVFASLLALESLVREGEDHGRCVVLIEASEESGSPDLDAYLDHLRDHLGDVTLMICLDSGAVTYDRLWVTTSLRGNVTVEVTVRVMDQGRHSGSASGVVPSSFRILRELLDRIEDSRTGRIIIPELNVEIPEAHVVAARQLAQEFGDVVAEDLPVVGGLELMGADAGERILRQTWHATLSVTGMGGIPSPDSAGNVLRPFTTAALSFRLPPTVDATVASEAIVRTLSQNPPHNAVVEVVAHGAQGWAASEPEPWLREALDTASRQAFGRTVGFTGEGGTIPFLASLGARYPRAQFVATGVLGPNSNAHGIDEMLDLTYAVGVTNSVITLLREHAKR